MITIKYKGKRIYLSEEDYNMLLERFDEKNIVYNAKFECYEIEKPCLCKKYYCGMKRENKERCPFDNLYYSDIFPSCIKLMNIVVFGDNENCCDEEDMEENRDEDRLSFHSSEGELYWDREKDEEVREQIRKIYNELKKIKEVIKND